MALFLAAILCAFPHHSAAVVPVRLPGGLTAIHAAGDWPVLGLWIAAEIHEPTDELTVYAVSGEGAAIRAASIWDRMRAVDATRHEVTVGGNGVEETFLVTGRRVRGEWVYSARGVE